MLEKLIKKDKSQELEKILEHKIANEQAKNLLQGILYKIDASYKDYGKVKTKKQTQEQFVTELLKNIEKKCEKINVVKLKSKLADEKVQEELEKKQFYVGEEIVSYPLEERILYAIEKKTRYPKILNNKYEETTIAVSELINTGKILDRTEVLRDFNGWCWTTIHKEIENIEANLIYQILQIIIGEEFVNNWCEDKDGIIDYLEQFENEIHKKYGEKTANNLKNILIKIAIANTIKNNKEFEKTITQKIEKTEEELKNYEDTHKKIVQISNNNKKLLKELNEIEKLLGQPAKLIEEFEKKNEKTNKKTFNINLFKNQLENRKQQILQKIEKNNYLLNPTNYIEEKNKLLKQKDKLKNMKLEQEEIEEKLIEFVDNSLKCFRIIIKKTKELEEIIRLIYQFRYLILLPFNLDKKIKDVEQLQKSIIETEKKLTQKAIDSKLIADIPFEVMKHVLETRIIKLEDLFYKITQNENKFYAQIFDGNISEEKFEIQLEEKARINKKIRIFI